MIADTQYNDLIGTVAADISDHVGTDNTLKELGSYFNIDNERLKVVGISIYGTESFRVSFICIDIEKSKNGKEFIVKVDVGLGREKILDVLFKRLHIVLFDRFDSKYSTLDYDKEVQLRDYQIR